MDLDHRVNEIAEINYSQPASSSVANAQFLFSPKSTSYYLYPLVITFRMFPGGCSSAEVPTYLRWLSCRRYLRAIEERRAALAACGGPHALMPGRPSCSSCRESSVASLSRRSRFVCFRPACASSSNLRAESIDRNKHRPLHNRRLFGA